MEPARSEAIARRPDEESLRESFPRDFPDPIDVPTARYTDPAFLELEREHVLERSWLFVAHADQLPEPGDYPKLDALERMGHPVFLVRGRDGTLRAFYNVCRHRGGPLVDQPSGSTDRNLVCGYHAWTYDLEGRLLGFPEAKNFPRNTKSKCPPLSSVACESWGPLVFVKLRGEGPGLREFLEPVASELDGLLGDDAAGVHYAGRKSCDVECNWKLPSDGNIETYHVPYVHKDSAAMVLDEKRTGQWLLPRGHSRMLIRFRQPLPAELPRFEGDTELAELGIYSFHVFPNLSIVMGGPTSAFLITAFPDGVGRCAYYSHFLSPVARTDETAAMVDAGVELNWNVLLEDLACMSSAQKGMECGALDVLRLHAIGPRRSVRFLDGGPQAAGGDRPAAQVDHPAGAAGAVSRNDVRQIGRRGQKEGQGRGAVRQEQASECSSQHQEPRGAAAPHANRVADSRSRHWRLHGGPWPCEPATRESSPGRGRVVPELSRFGMARGGS